MQRIRLVLGLLLTQLPGETCISGVRIVFDRTPNGIPASLAAVQALGGSRSLIKNARHSTLQSNASGL
jgi:hypothetical protein